MSDVHAWVRRPPRQKQGGQAYAEFLIILPVVLLFIGAVLYFGRVLYVHIAVNTAAYDCARTAAEAMQPGGRQGVQQGVTAALNTLEGFYVDRRGASAAVSFPDQWGRGRQIECQVAYRMSLKGMPFVYTLPNAPQQLTVRSSARLRVEEYKSEWRR